MPDRPDPKPGDPTVPFSSVVPGLRQGEGPEGPDGALSTEQRMRMMQASRQRIAAQIDPAARVVAVPVVAAEPTPPRKPYTPPAVEETLAFSPIPADLPQSSGGGSNGGDVAPRRIRDLHGRKVDVSDDVLAAREAEREATRLRDLEQEKKALELYGEPRHTGWDIGPPSRRKLLTLLSAHHRSTKNLCATCRHAVQIVHPIPDLGGIADAHQIRTFCSVIREEQGRNLEIEDSPVNFCSFYRWSLRAALRRTRVRIEADLFEAEEGSGIGGRLRRAVAALVEDPKKEEGGSRG